MNGIQGVNGVRNIGQEKSREALSTALSVVGPLANLMIPGAGTAIQAAGNFALKAHGGDVEVEGGETMQLPNGGMMDFAGKPNHEQGGHKMTAPVNSFVFSERLGYKPDLSFAKYSKKIKNQAGSARSELAQNTLNAVKKDNRRLAKQLTSDVTGLAMKAYDGDVKKMAPGGLVNPLVNPLMSNIGFGQSFMGTQNLSNIEREFNTMQENEAFANADMKNNPLPVPQMSFPRIPSMTGPPAMDFTRVSDPTTPTGGEVPFPGPKGAASVEEKFRGYDDIVSGINLDNLINGLPTSSPTLSGGVDPKAGTEGLSVDGGPTFNVSGSGSTLSQILPKLPSIGMNIVQGLLPAEREQFQRNTDEPEIRRLMDQRVSLDPVRRQINMQNNIARNVNRNAPTGAVVAARNAQANAQALRALGQLSLQQQQMNNQLDSQEANVLNQLGSANRNERVRVATVNAQNRAAKNNSLATGFNQISQVGSQVAAKRIADQNTAVNLAYLTAKFPNFNIGQFLDKRGRLRVDDVVNFSN